MNMHNNIEHNDLAWTGGSATYTTSWERVFSQLTVTFASFLGVKESLLYQQANPLTDRL